MPNLPTCLAEVVGVEPTQDISPATLAGSCHTVRRDFRDLNLAGATRVERASSYGGRGFGVRCIASYATPLLLVHAAGLEPAVSRRCDPDLQSGAFAAEATHAKSVILKNDEGRELEAPEDTLRRTLLPRMARPSGLSQSNEAEPSREGIPALISLFTGTSVIKQRKERAASTGKLTARSNNSLRFS